MGLESSPEVHHVEVELYDGGKLSETVNDTDSGAVAEHSQKPTQRLLEINRNQRR